MTTETMTRAIEAQTKVTITPLADRVVIRPAQRDAATASGVILPDTVQEKPQRGTVIAAGSGELTEKGRRIPLEVSAGNEVLYAKYAGAEVKINNEDLLIISEKDILAIV